MPSPDAPRCPSASSAGTIAAGSGALRAGVIQPAMPPIRRPAAGRPGARSLRPSTAARSRGRAPPAWRASAPARSAAARSRAPRRRGARRARIDQQPAQLALEARLVSRRDQAAAHAVGHHFRDAADRRNHHRHAGGHRLAQADGQRLVVRRQREHRRGLEQRALAGRADPAGELDRVGDAEALGVARHRDALAIARAHQAHVGQRGAQRRDRLEQVENSLRRLETAEEQDQIGTALERRRIRRAELEHRVGQADRVRVARDAAHPGAHRLARNDHARRAREQAAHQHAAIVALEPRAVQLHHQRRARRQRRRHEQRIARRIAAGAEVQVDDRVPMAREQQREAAQGAGEERGVARRAAIAVRGR